MDFHGGPTSMACPVAVAVSTCAGAGSPWPARGSRRRGRPAGTAWAWPARAA